jgi:ATP-binding cassette subfamily F protein 3
LLLDEPTNYLDLEGALWLEARLRKYPYSAIVISHDRELLNNSVGYILHIAEQKLHLYTGGFDSFEEQRAEKARLLEANRAKVEAKRAHMQAFVTRFGAKASKATQAQSRLKMLAKLPVIELPIEERVAPFTLPSPKRPLAPPLLRLEEVAVGYDGRAILRHLNLRLDEDDRIGLLGVNGVGKSTFAKLVAEALPLMAGHMHRDKKMKVGWFHQHQIEALDPTDTALEIVRRALPEASESQRRSKLAQWGLGFDKQETTVANLSGGERARLLLNLVAMEAPHLLILDEPTNHLDIDSRRALLEALNDYEGAVILITHDRSLMELVADRLWLADAGGIKPFEGDMEDYAKFVLERARQAGSGKAAPPPPPPPAQKQSASTLRHKLEKAEQALTKATTLLAQIDEQLADPKTYALPMKVTDLKKKRVTAEAALQAAETEWMKAAEAAEGVA